MARQIRQPIDVSALERYLTKHVPHIQVPIELGQFGFGQSNPTYQLTSADGSRYVLRKKPPGKLLSKTAHKVEREYRVITALGETDLPVPKTHCLCEDETVIGTAFYIMEFLDGRIFEDAGLPGLDHDERTSLWKAAVQTMSKLHGVEYRKIGLETIGKSGGFYDRQLETWKRICPVQAKVKDVDTGIPVGDVPLFNELVQYFSDEKLQPRDRCSLIHGDYKLDNLVFHRTEPRVIGILDWEMTTVGHPLSDLANLLHAFYTTSLRPKYMSDSFQPGITPGLPTAETIVAWYSEIVGWDPRAELTWAVAFSIFRSAAICQGIAARIATKQSTSKEARNYADAFRPLAHFAWQMARGEKEDTGGATQAKL